jgi:molecular chaperone GrpE
MIRRDEEGSVHGEPHGDESRKSGPEKQGGQGETQAADVESQAKSKSGPPDLLAAKTRECEDLVEQIKRLAAEFSNYQKRSDRRMEEERRLIVRDFVLDLLPGIDNLERTLAAAEKTQDVKVLADGLRMALEQFLAGLKKNGITPIEADGKPFSPEHHDAVAHVPSDEHAAGHVIEELQKGYRLHDRTIRPSRVAVSKGKPEAPQGEELTGGQA